MDSLLSASPSVLHITANSRLSQYLKQSLLSDAWAENQVAYTPQVMTLEQWWQQWEDAALMSGQLPISELPSKRLSAFEAQYLWETLLDKEVQQQPNLALLNPSATAKQLYQAWCLWLEYDLQSSMKDLYLTEEVRLFERLRQQYQAELDSRNWLDDSLYASRRFDWLAQAKPPLPSQIYLHGFDDMTPMRQRWMGWCESQGVMLEEVAIAPENLASEQWRSESNQPQQEAQQVALWCAELLEKSLQNSANEPLPKLAIVAPNVADVEADLRWALDEVLYQRFGQKLALQGRTQPLYNLSLGQSLLDSALVENALQTLEILMQPQRRLAYTDWSNWLVSPYTQGDWLQRQKADRQLRQWQWPTLLWPALLTELQTQQQAVEDGESKRRPPQLPKSLYFSLRQLSEKDWGKLSLSQFVEQANALLGKLEWGTLHGERRLNSDEFQQKETFQQVLTRFGSLQLAQGKQNLSVWLRLLRRFVSEQIHQSKTKGQVPIQIMGMLEAGGQDFDALWVMGLTDEAWPRMPNPNPFLPMTLQREQGLPRADALRELQYAERITERLAHSAKTLVWSYAKQQGDQVCLPSPLLQLPCLQAAQPYAQQAYNSLAQQAWQQAEPLEWVEDAEAPPVPLGDKAPGGTQILSAQNACPLMAFMDFRLGAKQTLEEVDEGLRSHHLGTLVHEVLELFWREVETQTALLAMTEAQRQDKVAELLTNAMEPMQSQFDGHYLALEHQRILTLIMEWLGLETERTGFKVILFEADYVLEIAGILFHVKIDRVDELTGGSDKRQVILDYKTGKASAKDLLKTPIEAPQLAVYLHAIQQNVAGLGYGILHSDDGAKFNLLLQEEGVLTEAKADRSQIVFEKLADKEGGEFDGVHWTDFLDDLRAEVTDLAEAVQQGRAEMVYGRETDLVYTPSRLALRLPEVKQQLGETAGGLDE